MSDKTARLRAEVQGVAIYIALHDRSADETTLTPRGMQRLDSALDAYVTWRELVARYKALAEVYDLVNLIHGKQPHNGELHEHDAVHAIRTPLMSWFQLAAVEAEE